MGMTREEAIEVFNELKKCYLGGIVDAIDMAIEALKAQEHEALDMPKPDSDIGCWYDITHNYTLEQVVSALKSRELCEDAVSRKYLLGQSYSIKFQTINESDEEAYREKVVCVEDIEDAPSVQPVPVARVMTAEDMWTLKFNDTVIIEQKIPSLLIPVIVRDNIKHDDALEVLQVVTASTNGTANADYEYYGKTWRCWTSRPDEKRRAETPWN